MNTITLNKALSDFPKLIETTLNNFEETVIVGDMGAVVLVAQSEWESIMETIHLLMDRESLKALIEGHNNRKKGEFSENKSIQQAFYDIQDSDS